MRIVLDAGHGPNTPGKRCCDGSMREFEFNSAVVEHIIQLLSDYEVGLLLVHDATRDVPLQERVRKANEWKVDLYVSVHANASGTTWNDAQGIETYCYHNVGESFTLAAEVQTQLIRETNRKNRSVKTAPFYVLKHTAMPSILCECGFMTNLEEAELLKSDAYRLKCAKAIVAGIVKVYKLRLKVTTPAPQPVPTVDRLISGVVNENKMEGVLIGGKAYLPIREVSQALGGTLIWDSKTYTVYVKK